jgi:hypothetical protein
MDRKQDRHITRFTKNQNSSKFNGVRMCLTTLVTVFKDKIRKDIYKKKKDNVLFISKTQIKLFSLNLYILSCY